MGVLEPREVAQGAVGQDGGPRQLGDELLHRLAHPPRRVRPERDAPVRVVALEGAQQADDALLQQLHPVDLRRGPVGARGLRDQRQEGIDQRGLRGRVAGPRPGDQLALMSLRERRALVEGLEIAIEG